MLLPVADGIAQGTHHQLQYTFAAKRRRTPAPGLKEMSIPYMGSEQNKAQNEEPRYQKNKQQQQQHYTEILYSGTLLCRVK